MKSGIDKYSHFIGHTNETSEDRLWRLQWRRTNAEQPLLMSGVAALWPRWRTSSPVHPQPGSRESVVVEMVGRSLPLQRGEKSAPGLAVCRNVQLATGQNGLDTCDIMSAHRTPGDMRKTIPHGQ